MIVRKPRKDAEVDCISELHNLIRVEDRKDPILEFVIEVEIAFTKPLLLSLTVMMNLRVM